MLLFRLRFIKIRQEVILLVYVLITCLNTYDQQFTLTTKKSLHIMFNERFCVTVGELLKVMA